MFLVFVRFLEPYLILQNVGSKLRKLLNQNFLQLSVKLSFFFVESLYKVNKSYLICNVFLHNSTKQSMVNDSNILKCFQIELLMFDCISNLIWLFVDCEWYALGSGKGVKSFQLFILQIVKYHSRSFKSKFLEKSYFFLFLLR